MIPANSPHVVQLVEKATPEASPEKQMTRTHHVAHRVQEVTSIKAVLWYQTYRQSDHAYVGVLT